MSHTKILCFLVCLLLPATGLAYDLKFGEKDFGKLVGQIKGMSVLHGLDNGYDPETGSAYLLKLKYITPSFYDFKAAASNRPADGFKCLFQGLMIQGGDDFVEWGTAVLSHGA